jgi:hypothetical protein
MGGPMGVQRHCKKRFTKKSCRKVFRKKSTKKSKPFFSRFVFAYHVFGRFSVRRVQKHHQINQTLVPGPFLFFGL